MKIHLKLYGTLPRFYVGPYPEGGLEIEGHIGISVSELVEVTGIPREKVSLVTINDLLAKADDVIPEKSVVKFFQPLSGG